MSCDRIFGISGLKGYEIALRPTASLWGKVNRLGLNGAPYTSYSPDRNDDLSRKSQPTLGSVQYGLCVGVENGDLKSLYSADTCGGADRLLESGKHRASYNVPTNVIAVGSVEGVIGLLAARKWKL